MMHLTWLDGMLISAAGAMALLFSRIVFKVVFGLGRIAFVLARIVAICFVAGLELVLLINSPEVFAAEFLAVAGLAYAWRRFERDRGYSPVIALRRRLHLGARAPLVLEQLSEDVEVVPDDRPVIVPEQKVREEAPVDAGSDGRIDVVSWLDSEINGSQTEANRRQSA